MTNDNFQVLALDGGGVKALFSAHVLACIEEDLSVRIRDTFDLIVGTSAGGIIALALGAGMRPVEIVEHFGSLAKNVFPTRRRLSPWRLVRPAYSDDVLRNSLTDVLGHRRLADSDKRLVIPAYDVGRGELHVFKTAHHRRFTRDWRIPMVDVAMATCAAPSFFRAANVNGVRLVDGGIWANNPSVVGITEAVSVLNVKLETIRLLNIGTTTPLGVHPRKLDRGGLIRWMFSAVNVVLAANSCGTAGVAEHLLNRDRYQRFDAPVPKGLYALDKAHAGDLQGLASAVSRHLSPEFSDIFAAHKAARFTSLHADDHEEAA